MSFIKILTLISSISFIVYGIAYFTSPHMKNEFRRFGLEKLGLLTAILELVGASSGIGQQLTLSRLFLQPISSWITGQILLVDGGFLQLKT